jgi:DNA-binding transcriptional LysR family regulator
MSLGFTASVDSRGTTQVDNWIAAYLKRWLRVTVETVYSIRFVDLIHEGIDVAIRLGVLPNSDLSARRLGEIGYRLYASAEYLQRSPPPQAKRGCKIVLIASGFLVRSTWVNASSSA